MPKLCPMSVLIHYSSTDDAEKDTRAQCVQENCGWWDDEEYDCAILLIAKTLKGRR